MSTKELEDQIDNLLTKRDNLEEKCDTLPQCAEDDGCETCKTYKQIEEIDIKIEELEAKIEQLTAEEDEGVEVEEEEEEEVKPQKGKKKK
jgi:hypothetical protein